MLSISHGASMKHRLVMVYYIPLVGLFKALDVFYFHYDKIFIGGLLAGVIYLAHVYLFTPLVSP